MGLGMLFPAGGLRVQPTEKAHCFADVVLNQVRQLIDVMQVTQNMSPPNAQLHLFHRNKLLT